MNFEEEINFLELIEWNYNIGKIISIYMLMMEHFVSFIYLA